MENLSLLSDDKTTANIGICKSWAEGSRVSTCVFQFDFR